MSQQANSALRRRKKRKHDLLVDRMMKFKLATPEGYKTLVGCGNLSSRWETLVCKFFGLHDSRTSINRLHRIAKGQREGEAIYRVWHPTVDAPIWIVLIAELNNALGEDDDQA